eukprot:Pgem_evm1s18962
MLLTTCGVCKKKCGYNLKCKTCKIEVHKQCSNVGNDPDYENIICNSCMINSTATETALACTVCNKEVGMAHKCSQ